MECPWLDRLPELIRRPANDSNRRALEAHLASCPNCVQEADRLRSFSSVLRGASARTPCPSEQALARFVENPADPAVETHVTQCVECRQTVDVASHASESEVRASLKSRLLGRLAHRRLSSSTRSRLPAHRPQRSMAPAFVIGIAAAVLLAVAVALLSDRSSPAPAADRAPVTTREPGPRVVEPRATPDTNHTAQNQEKPRTEQKKEERIVDDRRPEEKREPPLVEDKKPEETKPEQKKESPVVVDKKPEEKTEPVVFEGVTGELRVKDRTIQTGDKVMPTDVLKTPFGSHATIRIGGATLVLHQQSELALSPGPVARLASGQMFVKSTPNLRVETAAGTISPSGTEFTVEIAGTATLVAVRDGSVLFQNARGKARVEKGQIVRCVNGQAPGTPRAIEAAYFEWTRKAESESYVMSYPGALRTGVIIAAPHGGAEAGTEQMGAHLAERLKSPFVVAHEAREKGSESGTAESEREKSAAEEYQKAVRETAGPGGAKLILEIHGYTEKDDMPVIECASAGFNRDDMMRIKQSFARIVEKHKPDIKLVMMCDLTDPKYKLGDKEISFRYGSSEMKKKGIFRQEVTAHGLKIELPAVCRKNAKYREQYEVILADWIESLR